MYCKHCGKSIDDDSTFCCECGKRVTPKAAIRIKHIAPSPVQEHNGQKVVRNGETLTIRDGILFDEDGWDVGRVPRGYIPGYGDSV